MGDRPQRGVGCKCCAENRLVAVTNGGYAIENGYDWRHRRMSTTAGTGSCRTRHALAYDGWAIVHERVDADRGAGWVRVRDIEYVDFEQCPSYKPPRELRARHRELAPAEW